MPHQGVTKQGVRRLCTRAAGLCAALCLVLPASAESPVTETAAFQDGSAAPRGSGRVLGLHSDLRFLVLAPPRQKDEAVVAAQRAQVKRVAARLQAGAQRAYPDALKRIDAFDVYIADTEKPVAMSSGTGKIALSAGLLRAQPGDAWLAFVIAREMGHVISGHHDSNAGASIAASLVMNLIVPGSGLLKSALSLGGSEIASASGSERQGAEADQVAFRLLEAAGYTDKVVLRELRLKPLSEEATGSWATGFRASVARASARPARKAPDALLARSGAAGSAGATVQLASGRGVAPQRGRAAAATAPVLPVSYAASGSPATACAACGAQP